MTKRTFECSECGHVWRVIHGVPLPTFCPECESKDIHRAPEDRSQGRIRSRDRERGREDRFHEDD